MTDAETTAATQALAHRLRERDEAMRGGGDYADADVFAAEFMLALRTKGGWRPTAARAASVAPKHAPPAPDAGLRDELLAEARARCAVSPTRVHPAEDAFREDAGNGRGAA